MNLAVSTSKKFDEPIMLSTFEIRNSCCILVAEYHLIRGVCMQAFRLVPADSASMWQSIQSRHGRQGHELSPYGLFTAHALFPLKRGNPMSHVDS